ncbi:MAG: ABC transporter permease, partial [Acidobacteriota bacterium]
MNNLWQGIRSGLRIPNRHKAFAIVVILTLAVAIAANTLVFSLFRSVFLAVLPYPGADRLVMVWESYPEFPTLWVSYPNYRDWRSGSSVVEDLAICAGWMSVTLAGANESHNLRASFVSPGYFSVLGAGAEVGRTFLPSEGQVRERDPVAILSHPLWQRRFGGEPKVIGETIRLSGMPHVVVGVMPPHFRDISTLTHETDVWLPMGLFGRFYLPDTQPSALERRGWRLFWVVGRLRKGYTLPQAQHALDSLADGLAEKHPETNAGYGIHLVPMRDHFFDAQRIPVLALFAGAGLLLLIASANVANLYFVHAIHRWREI